MKLAPGEAMARLVAHDHGILCTVHATRGVDAVPCVFAVDDEGHVGIPSTASSPSRHNGYNASATSSRPRATLLVEH